MSQKYFFRVNVDFPFYSFSWSDAFLTLQILAKPLVYQLNAHFSVQISHSAPLIPFAPAPPRYLRFWLTLISPGFSSPSSRKASAIASSTRFHHVFHDIFGGIYLFLQGARRISTSDSVNASEKMLEKMLRKGSETYRLLLRWLSISYSIWRSALVAWRTS